MNASITTTAQTVPTVGGFRGQITVQHNNYELGADLKSTNHVPMVQIVWESSDVYETEVEALAAAAKAAVSFATPKK